MLKKCSRCGLSKPLQMYHKRKDSTDGRQWQCKQCASEYQRQLYAKRKKKQARQQQQIEQQKAILHFEQQQYSYYYECPGCSFEGDQGQCPRCVNTTMTLAKRMAI